MKIPFIESVPEESKQSVTSFITNTGIAEQDLEGFSSFDEFLSGYKPKTSSAPDWVAALSEEDRSFVGVKGWKTPVDTIKGYKELEKLVGHQKIAMPKKDAQGNWEKGELERVLGQLGLPKDPKEYKTSANFKLPEGVELNAEMLTSFNDKAHKAGLLPHQYAFVMDELGNIINQGTQGKKELDKKSFNDAALALRGKWGLAYDEKSKLASSVLRNFATDEESGKKLVEKYGNDPAVIELLANIGSGLSEESLTRINMTSSMLTPESAKLEIMKVRSEREKELNNASHPQHQFWVERLAELYRMASTTS